MNHSGRKHSLSALLFASLLSVGSACSNSAQDYDCSDGRCEDPNGVANAICQQHAAELCERLVGEGSTAQEASDSVFSSMRECAEQTFQACRDELALTSHCEGRRDDSLNCSSESLGSNYLNGGLRWAAQDVSCVTSGSGLNLIDCQVNTSGLVDVDNTEGEDDRGRSREELTDARFDSRDNFSGVTDGTGSKDDRGQEYTEYFAVVQLPPQVTGEPLPAPLVIGQVGSAPRPIDFEELQAAPAFQEMISSAEGLDQAFGSCVFTSWHQDNERELEVPGQLPAPPNRASWLGESYDLDMDADLLRMRIGINSNNAAADLVDNCTTDIAGYPDMSAEDKALISSTPRLSPNHVDDYERGCMRTYELFTTEWRRSDPTICTAPMKLAECGCSLEVSVGEDSVAVPVGLGVDLGEREWAAVAKLLVPSLGSEQSEFYQLLADVAGEGPVADTLQALADRPEDSQYYLRGFPLGTWNDSSVASAKIGERLTGSPFIMASEDCTALGGAPTEDGSCEVATWGSQFASEALSAPEGCRYVQIAEAGSAFVPDGSAINNGLGEHGRNVMVCDITLNKITQVMSQNGASPQDAFVDMKSFCQAAFAGDVVVHIPYQDRHIPQAQIVCESDAPECAFAQANPAKILATSTDEGVCSSDRELEVVSRERLPDAVLDQSGDDTEESQRREECETVCVKGQPCGDGCVPDDMECTKPQGSACKGNPADLSSRLEDLDE